MKHLVNLIDEMNRKKIGFNVLSGAEIDTTTAHGKLIFGIFAALAEFERELIRERTQAGLAAARARGGSLQEGTEFPTALPKPFASLGCRQ